MVWSVIDPADVALRVDAVADANWEHLQVIAGLDDHGPESLDDHPALAQELQRLDFKLNVILDMISRLQGAAGDLPARVPVRLSASHLGFTTTAEIAVGQMLEIELYLYARYVFPIVLFGTVEGVSADHDVRSVTVRLSALADDAQALYEKSVFRCHRRQVARRRRPV